MNNTATQITPFAGIRAQRRAQEFHPANEPPESWSSNLLGLSNTGTGATVNAQTAMGLTAFYACVRVISESVASLPLKTYRRTGSGKEPAYNHALYSLLHDMPNPEMTSFEFREAMTAHLCVWGNAYAEIEMNKAGAVVALWLLRPDRMRVKRSETGALVYVYTLPNGGTKTLPDSIIMHIRGLGANGIVGYSPVSMARNALGMALATESMGNAFYGNGARPGGVLEHPGKLSTVAYDRLRDSWEARHQGLSNANRVAILEEGLKWQDVGMPMEDAQFLQTRKFQLGEIARMFRMPPHMIGDLDRATFSNIEQQSIDFVVNTLRPWLVRWEQAIMRDLIGRIERSTIFAEFLVDGLLRGDITSRYAAYATGRNNGWLSPNDIRGMENMNAIPGGDVYITPLNMQPLQQIAQPAPKPAEQNAWRSVYETLMRDAMARVLRREQQDVSNQRRKYNGINDEWRKTFAIDHTEFVVRTVTPAVSAVQQICGATFDVAAVANAIAQARLQRCFAETPDELSWLVQHEAQNLQLRIGENTETTNAL